MWCVIRFPPILLILQAPFFGFCFCFLESSEANPVPKPTGARLSVYPFVSLSATEPFEVGALLESLVFVDWGASVAVELLLIMLRSWVSDKDWTGAPFWRARRPLAAAFFRASAAARAALASLPRETVSPIRASLRDLLIDEELAFPDPEFVAWNACIKSGWAW